MKDNIENEEEKEKDKNKDEKKETEEEEENKIEEKINAVPDEMRCYLCDDFCEDPVQILCCNEVFCKKHITEEIIKRFMCPKCKQKCGINNIIENKKLSEDIRWFKKLLNDLI